MLGFIALVTLLTFVSPSFSCFVDDSSHDNFPSVLTSTAPPLVNVPTSTPAPKVTVSSVGSGGLFLKSVAAASTAERLGLSNAGSPAPPSMALAKALPTLTILLVEYPFALSKSFTSSPVIPVVSRKTLDPSLFFASSLIYSPDKKLL